MDAAFPIESTALAAVEMAPPFSGRFDFSAGGSGTFDRPRYDVRGTISDLFVGDEGIGQVVGEINVNVDMMTLKVEAASPRLAVSGSGRIALTPGMEADLSFSVSDTSLDPYVRAVNPNLSPFTTAIGSGNIRVVGQLANIDELLVDATVDRLDLRLFDYRLRNAAPIRLALDRHVMRIDEMRLVGEETQLDITGTVNLHDERIAVRATGDAGLGLLQGFDLEHPQLGARLAPGLVRRAHARSARDGDDDGRERARPPLRSSACPRKHLRTRAVRHTQRSSRRGDGAAWRRARSGLAAASTWKATGRRVST